MKRWREEITLTVAWQIDRLGWWLIGISNRMVARTRKR
jgi:hypothetical protein